jgi:signal transduction histidine kinase
MGILGMEERVVLAGGRLVVDSRVGGGTEVRVWLPLDRMVAHPDERET